MVTWASLIMNEPYGEFASVLKASSGRASFSLWTRNKLHGPIANWVHRCRSFVYLIECIIYILYILAINEYINFEARHFFIIYSKIILLLETFVCDLGHHNVVFQIYN